MKTLYSIFAGLAMCAVLLSSSPAQAQFRNNGIYLPQTGYFSLELMNGQQKFGSSDGGFIGFGGLSSLGYNFWATYRLWLGFSLTTGDHAGPDMLTTLHIIPGIRYNFLDEEFRPYVEGGFQTMWFLYTDGTNVPVNAALGDKAIFGGPRLAAGFEWYFYDEMSISAEVAAHLYLTIGTMVAPGVSSMIGYTVYY